MEDKCPFTIQSTDYLRIGPITETSLTESISNHRKLNRNLAYRNQIDLGKSEEGWAAMRRGRVRPHGAGPRLAVWAAAASPDRSAASNTTDSET